MFEQSDQQARAKIEMLNNQIRRYKAVRARIRTPQGVDNFLAGAVSKQIALRIEDIKTAETQVDLTSEMRELLKPFQWEVPASPSAIPQLRPIQNPQHFLA
jgi:hypothetical protein